MASPILTFDYNQFIAYFPNYSNPAVYPASTLQQWWNIAIFYISNSAYCGSLNGDARQYAIYLMMAHLIYLSGLQDSGQTPYILASATIDKVSVSLQQPPGKNQWEWWLNSSPYGMQLLALLQVKSVGGYYIGGSPVLAGFRFANVGRGGFRGRGGC